MSQGTITWVKIIELQSIEQDRLMKCAIEGEMHGPEHYAQFNTFINI